MLLAGIEAASVVGFQTIKLNMVVIQGQNDHELVDFLRYSFDHPVTIRFIEFIPIGGNNSNKWKDGYQGVDKVFTVCQEQGWGYQPVKIKGNGPSKDYQLTNAKGTFGIIRPISCQFCESCNRFRVTADGYLKSCLYWDDEIHLRPVIGNREEFQKRVYTSLGRKPKNHEMALDENEQSSFQKPTWRHMSQIGG